VWTWMEMEWVIVSVQVVPCLASAAAAVVRMMIHDARRNLGCDPCASKTHLASDL